MENLPRELISKIFYYIGNTSPHIIELKNVISKLHSSKTIMDHNSTYSYESIVKDDGWYIFKIFFSDFIGDFYYSRIMSISQAILLCITRRYLIILEDYYEEITLDKLGFDIFNVRFVEIFESDDDENFIFDV
jgi:hypothetical protein